MVDGMMQAAAKPWRARPVIRRGRARAPVAATSRADPRMLRPTPARAIFTRPMRSKLGPIRDDVRLRPGLQAPDGDHAELARRDLSGHDALEAHHDRRGEDDGVDSEVRH